VKCWYLMLHWIFKLMMLVACVACINKVASSSFVGTKQSRRCSRCALAQCNIVSTKLEMFQNYTFKNILKDVSCINLIHRDVYKVL
jgi:hypothetical protein